MKKVGTFEGFTQMQLKCCETKFDNFYGNDLLSPPSECVPVHESIFFASAYRCPTICYEMIATENSANKFAFIYFVVKEFFPRQEN